MGSASPIPNKGGNGGSITFINANPSGTGPVATFGGIGNGNGALGTITALDPVHSTNILLGVWKKTCPNREAPAKVGVSLLGLELFKDIHLGRAVNMVCSQQTFKGSSCKEPNPFNEWNRSGHVDVFRYSARAHQY